jgi:hypothetical protein
MGRPMELPPRGRGQIPSVPRRPGNGRLSAFRCRPRRARWRARRRDPDSQSWSAVLRRRLLSRAGRRGARQSSQSACPVSGMPSGTQRLLLPHPTFIPSGEHRSPRAGSPRVWSKLPRQTWVRSPMVDPPGLSPGAPAHSPLSPMVVQAPAEAQRSDWHVFRGLRASTDGERQHSAVDLPPLRP